MYLKNIKNGEVFAHSPFLAVLPNFVPCNLDGSLPTEAVEEVEQHKTVEVAKRTSKKRG